jgi:hypothetical protein
VNSKITDSPQRAVYATPAEAYRYPLFKKMQRQIAVSSYAAYRQEAEKFDPSDDKAKTEKAKDLIVSRENNVVTDSDWAMALQKGTWHDWLIEKGFGVHGTAMTVYFIRHAHDLTRLKRIEFNCPGMAAPHVLLLN